jgi:CRISPR-associated protein Csm2
MRRVKIPMNRENLADLSRVTPQTLNELGDHWGQQLRSVKTHQIRNLYSAVQRIRATAERRSENQPENIAEINRQLIFLKPKLAYASGRQEKDDQKKIMRDLRDFLVKAIDGVVKSQDHKEARDNFFFLVESIVAYHKFYGGKDS